MHTCSVDIHVAGLQDGCPRCDELAEAPIANLDERMLTHLVQLARRDDRLGACRSENEARASAFVLTTLERAGRLAEVTPLGVEGYLRDRWHLQCRIVGRGMAAQEFVR